MVGGERRPRPTGLEKRRLGKARQVLGALVMEQAYLSAAEAASKQAPENYCDVLCIDLLEGWAGASNPSRMAHRYGLEAGPPAELDKGWDLSTPEG